MFQGGYVHIGWPVTILGQYNVMYNVWYKNRKHTKKATEATKRLNSPDYHPILCVTAEDQAEGGGAVWLQYRPHRASPSVCWNLWLVVLDLAPNSLFRGYKCVHHQRSTTRDQQVSGYSVEFHSLVVADKWLFSNIIVFLCLDVFKQTFPSGYFIVSW